MEINNPDTQEGGLKPVTVGIDVGSVSSRAFMWHKATNTDVPISNPSRYDTLLASSRYEKGDFSSTCYPFDKEYPVYHGIGTTPDPRRQSTSLKFAPYILVNSSDRLLEQYQLFNSLNERRNDTEFRRRLRLGLENLFVTMADRIREVCALKRYVVEEVALTVPAQWTLEFEDLYLEIVSQVFSLPVSSIYFITETEALAHFLLQKHTDCLAAQGGYSQILFLDFGGHNMNGCLFEVVTGQNGNKAFYRAGLPFGAGGGSEQWEDHIGRLCGPMLQKRHQLHMTAPHRQALLDDFNRMKVGLGPISVERHASGPAKGQAFLVLRDDGRCWDAVIEKKEVDRAWELAHARPLQLSRDRVKDLAHRNTVRVVVSGGTGRHTALRERIEDFCKEANIDKPFFLDGLEAADPIYESVKIARGAAYAVGGRLSTEEFFQRGAAMGLQMKQGKDNPSDAWDDTGCFLAALGYNVPRQIKYVTEAFELKLVCDPFFSRREDQGGLGYNKCYLHYTKCYDVLSLATLPSGEWWISCRLKGTGNDMELVLEVHRKIRRQLAKVRFAKKPDGWPWKRDASRSGSFPLYFDPGANCVLVGARGRTLADLGLDWPRQGTDEEVDEDLEVSSTNEEGAQTTEGEGAHTPDVADNLLRGVQVQEVYTSGHATRRVKPQGSLRNQRFDPLEYNRVRRKQK